MGTDLRGVVLWKADLRGILTRPDLPEDLNIEQQKPAVTALTGADLSGADLTGDDPEKYG